MAVATEQQGVRNTIRFLVKPELNRRIERGTFVKEVLFRTLNLKAEEIFCLQDNAGQGFYDVSFETNGQCLTVFEKCKELKEKLKEPTLLHSFELIPLFQMDEKPLTIHLYNPFTELAHVVAFLQRYCSNVRGGTKLKDVFGIPTGKLRFWVRFKPDPTSIGGVCHPPATFSLAGNRGYLVYPGQPRYCRMCFQFGHTQDNCPTGRCCRNCGDKGHEASHCPKPRTCDLCGSGEHLARNCPKGQRTCRSYADAARSGRGPIFLDSSAEEEQPQPQPEMPMIEALCQLPPLFAKDWSLVVSEDNIAAPSQMTTSVPASVPVSGCPPVPDAVPQSCKPQPLERESISSAAMEEAPLCLQTLEDSGTSSPPSGLVSITSATVSPSSTVISQTPPSAVVATGLPSHRQMGEEGGWEMVRGKAKRQKLNSPDSIPCAQQPASSPLSLNTNSFAVLTDLDDNLSISSGPASPFLDADAVEQFTDALLMPKS